MKDKVRDIIAVIVGCIVIIATGILLFPVVKMLITRSFRGSIIQGATINFFDVNLYGFLWIAISCFVGGFITCWIAINKRLFYVLVTGILFFIAVLLINIIKGESTLWGFLLALSFVPFTFIGGIVRRLTEK